MTRLRVLVVDDDSRAERIYRALLHGHDLVRARTFSEARAARLGQDFALIIAEELLADGQGSDFFRALKAGGDRACRILHAAIPPEDPERLVAARIIDESLPKPSWLSLARSVASLSARPMTALHARGSTRVPLELTVFVFSEAWGAVRRVWTEDLSSSGLSLRSAEPLPLGERISLAVRLPDRSRLRFSGVVRNCLPVGQGLGARDWRIGVQLDDMQQLCETIRSRATG